MSKVIKNYPSFKIILVFRLKLFTAFFEDDDVIFVSHEKYAIVKSNKSTFIDKIDLSHKKLTKIDSLLLTSWLKHQWRDIA
jgi:hypothetical protein